MTATVERALRRIRRCGRRYPDAVRLARVASLAVRLEPYLLRRLRLEMLPDTDVGAEGDLWFSSLVESRGTDSIVLDADVAEVLRGDLAADRPAFTDARRITEDEHRNEPATIRLEEELHALAHSHESNATEMIDEALRPALRALQSGGERATEIAHWALRAAPRFHPTVRQSANALSLVLGAGATLGGRRILRQTPEVEVPLEKIAWVLSSEALNERISVSARLLERGILFSAPNDGDSTIELPRTNPLLIEVSWANADGTSGTLLQVEMDRTVDLEHVVETLTVRTLAGDEYVLERSGVAEADVMATCFVVMGFGRKTDPRTGRTLDLDQTYSKVIRPAVTAAGLECRRADELQTAGVISTQAMEQLWSADVVIADLSASNPHANYELGIRRALRPNATVVIAASETDVPLPLHGPYMHWYEQDDSEIDSDEADRLKNLLMSSVLNALQTDEIDSPPYRALPDLQAPVMNAAWDDVDKSGVCFVLMASGEQYIQSEAGRFDFEGVYHSAIVPAGSEAGLECVRIDPDPGSLVDDVFRQLLEADVVLADLSTSDPNILYLLGIRHVFRPYATIVMANRRSTPIFDLQRFRQLRYDAPDDMSKSGGSWKEVSAQLSHLLRKAVGEHHVDSPVYVDLPDLRPPLLPRVARAPAAVDVFLSYTRKDREAMSGLTAELRKLGVTVWFDAEELRAGESFEEKVRAAIRECGIFVPVLSRHTLEPGKGFFRREWQIAIDRAKSFLPAQPFIVPVVIDDIRAREPNLPREFAEIQWITGDSHEWPAVALRIYDVLQRAGTRSAEEQVAQRVTESSEADPRRAGEGETFLALPDATNDVFLSYARTDDSQAAGTGWVDAFHGALEARLMQVLGTRQLMVWRDEVSLSPGEQWAEMHDRAVEGAGVFVAIVSPSYLDSDWNNRELELFVTHNRLPNADERVFPVLKDPVAREAMPEMLRARVGYDLSSSGSPSESPPESEDEPFSESINDLALDIAKVLQRLREAGGSAP